MSKKKRQPTRKSPQPTLPGKPGRNEPCWCGSGKKYKLCHLAADEAQDRAWPPAPHPPAPAPAEEEDWDRFEAAGPEEKAAIFRERLAAGLLEGDEAYDMLLDIRAAGDIHHDPAHRALYDGLLAQLQKTAPALYKENRPWLLIDRIEDAIAAADWDGAAKSLEEFTPFIADHIDSFSQLRESLQYHNQIGPLLAAMERAWPAVRKSPNILPWGIEEFALEALAYHWYMYLERTPEPRADDPALAAAVAPYGTLNVEWLARYAAHVRRSAPSPWQPADFAPTLEADRWEQNLEALSMEWVGDLRRRTGTPLVKSEMARRELLTVLQRQMAQTVRPRRKKDKAAVAAPLVPQRDLLDQELAKHLDMISPAPYKAGCLMELLPDYLHFIARLGLITRAELTEALRALKKLADQFPPVLRAFGAAPSIVEAITANWSDEALAGRLADPALVETRVQPPTPTIKATPPGAVRTYLFKVTYLHDPEVWRTIELTADQTLDTLHHAIQAAVDFDEDHLYSFYMSGRAWDKDSEYTSPHADGPSAAKVRIGDLNWRLKQRFLYLFDYGDEHRFEVQLLAINPAAPKGQYPRIVERHGENPPQYDWDDEDEEEWDEEEWDEEEDEEEEDDEDDG